ncbi:MAG: Mur ligase family protein [Planctomycetota bacterium]
MQQLRGRADGISLRSVLPHGRFLATDDGDIHVNRCQSDYRLVRPGDVFVAVVNADWDGHNHVEQAIERGATAVVAERILPVSVPCCIVADTREANGIICQHLAGFPHRSLELIGITGTFGKTITTMLMASVLRAADRRTGVTCSMGGSDGQVTAELSSQSPAPPELAHWLSRMVLSGCTSGVIEVSSEALASRHLTGMTFDAAILTNLRRDHLDFHGNVKNYRRAKQRLFEHLKPDGVAVVNVDDSGSRLLMDQIDAPLITVGMRETAQLRAQLLERCPSEQTFLLIAGQESAPVRTHGVGNQFIHSCLSAAAVGLVMGLDLTTIVRGLEQADQVPGRLERIEGGQDFNVFVDQAQSPATLAASLHALKQVTQGRLICVYGATAWQSAETRANVGRLAERHADLGIITTNNPGHEPPLQIAHDILDGFEQPGQAHIIPNRGQAIEWALDQANPGDTVLVAGKGDLAYQIVGERTIPFDDRRIVRSWLRGPRPELQQSKSSSLLPFRAPCQWN